VYAAAARRKRIPKKAGASLQGWTLVTRLGLPLADGGPVGRA
jgi:hypothetical protein